MSHIFAIDIVDGMDPLVVPFILVVLVFKVGAVFSLPDLSRLRAVQKALDDDFCDSRKQWRW